MYLDNMRYFLEFTGYTRRHLSASTGIAKLRLNNILSGITMPSCREIAAVADFFGLPESSFYNKFVDYLYRVVVVKLPLKCHERAWLLYCNEMMHGILDILPAEKAIFTCDRPTVQSAASGILEEIGRDRIVPMLIRMPKNICGILSTSRERYRIMLINNRHSISHTIMLLKKTKLGSQITALNEVSNKIKSKLEAEPALFDSNTIISPRLLALYDYLKTEFKINMDTEEMINGGFVHFVKRRSNPRRCS